MTSHYRRAWIFVLLVTAIGSAVLFAAFQLHESGSPAESSTVLIFDLPAELEEAEVPFDPLALDWVRWSRPTLHRVVQGLRRAATDDHVVGLVLHVDELDWGWAKLTEVRDAILEFRSAGKPVYASLGGGGDAEYFLASAAGWVTMPPTATLQLDGLSESVMFYKGTFDKLDIHPNFAHAGRFKSAVERYTRTGMSPQTRESLGALLDDEYRLLVDTLAVARGIPAPDVESLLDQGPYAADEAIANGLVDSLLYGPDADSLALDDAGEDSGTMSFARYLDQLRPGRRGPRIALIAASGIIVPGRSRYLPDEGHGLGSETMTEALREARTRRSIKAVVLRIDSPGGEVPAADDIWREVERCREVKPVVVSMSDVAASGGYYIAAGADRIVADPGTVTGSIGVYGGKLNLLGLYRKLGLNVETLSRGRHAEMFSPFRDFSPEEAQIYARQMEGSYRTFLERVAEGRNISTEAADSLGQGRVWSGAEAYSRGLVDTLGGIQTAFEIALEEAGLSARRGFVVETIPKVGHPLIERMIEQWIGDGDNVAQLPGLTEAFRSSLAAARLRGAAVQARMPFHIEIR